MRQDTLDGMLFQHGAPDPLVFTTGMFLVGERKMVLKVNMQNSKQIEIQRLRISEAAKLPPCTTFLPLGPIPGSKTL